MDQEYFQFYEGDKMGIKTLDETIIVPATYDFVSAVSGGYFTVHNADKFSYYDTKGNLLFPFENKYENYCDFSEGLAAVYDGQHYGFIDETGKEVIAPAYVFAEKFSEGYAVVRNSENLHGIINTVGELVLDYTYVVITSFENGYAQVGDYHTWGLIDTTGKLIVPTRYAFLGKVEKGKLVVQVVEEGGYAKEGVLTLGGHVEWNNNLDDYNERLRAEDEFFKNCDALIENFYKDGCPCERPRFRDYIQWEGDIKMIDQEILWVAFAKKLKTEDDVDYECPTCGTTYQMDYKEFNVQFAVQEICITKKGNILEKGSEVSEIIPYAISFQGFELEGRLDKYQRTETQNVMHYLKG